MLGRLKQEARQAWEHTHPTLQLLSPTLVVLTSKQWKETGRAVAGGARAGVVVGGCCLKREEKS